MPSGVFELAGLPHVLFKFAYLLLVLEEELRGFAVVCNLGGEQEVMYELQGRVKPILLVSTILETP